MSSMISTPLTSIYVKLYQPVSPSHKTLPSVPRWMPLCCTTDSDLGGDPRCLGDASSRYSGTSKVGLFCEYVEVVVLGFVKYYHSSTNWCSRLQVRLCIDVKDWWQVHRCCRMMISMPCWFPPGSTCLMQPWSMIRRAPTLESRSFPDVSRIWGETQEGLSENRDALYLKRKMMINSQIMGK